MANLSVVAPGKEPFTFSLSPEAASIGRSYDNQLSIPDARMSRHHCMIYCGEAHKFFVEDRRSKHGTYVNGVRIGKRRELKDGDVLQIGETHLRFLEAAEGSPIEDLGCAQGPFSARTFPTDSLIGDCQVDTADGEAGAKSSQTGFRRAAMVSMRDFSLELLAQNRLDSVLDATLRFAGEAIPARRAVLMLRERRGDQLVSRAFRSFRPGEPARPIRICESIVKAVFENRASLITPDAQLDRRFNFSKSIFEDGIHSAICSPLWNDQKVTGLIYMDRSPDEAPFRKEELCLLSSLANMAALKVENTRLFEEALEKRALEEQLALASEIQRSLLPAHNPHVDGFDVAAFHVPCYQIGGDYYDFFELGENRIGLALGDVSGKGAGAALLMASLRAFLSSLVKQNRPLPSLLSELSAFIYRSSPFEKFITFFFAVLDTSSGRIRYVNAGHNAPLIVGHSEEAIRLDATGLPLGIFPDCRYEEGTARIRPGDLLVIYTDGVTERSTASEEEFGENRLVELLVTRKSAPAQEISEVVLASVDEFASGEVPQDDMTLVVVKRLQKGIALTE